MSSVRSEWLLAVVMTAGCSLGTVDDDPCESNADCRASFGINAVCQHDGLCSLVPIAPRCDRTYPADLYEQPERYKDAIVIGNLMDRSEPKKVARERAAQLAAMQVDEVAGLPGRTLAMVMCTIEQDFEGDGLDLEEAATRTALYLVDVVGTPAIVGPSSSTNTIEVFRELAGTDTLIISPAATSPALNGEEAPPSDELPGLLWRTAPSDSLQGQVIVDDMLARGITRAAAVIQRGAYGDGLFEVFEETLQGRIDVELFSYELDLERIEATTSAGLSNADEVLFISSESSDILAFLDTAAEDDRFDSKSLFLTDAAASADVVGAAAPALFTRLRGTRPKPLDDSELVYKNFINSYRDVFDDDVTQFSFTAHAYDAAWLVFYGSAWAHFNEASISGSTIARGLRRVSDGSPFEVKGTSWPLILESFTAGTGVDLRGSSGELDYDPGTEETSGEIEVWVVSGGEVMPAP